MKHQTDYFASEGVTNIRKIIDMPISKSFDVTVALITAMHLMEKQHHEILQISKSKHIHEDAFNRYQNIKALLDVFMNDKNFIGGHQ